MVLAGRRRAVVALTAALAGLISPAVAYAEPPSNDDFSGSTPIAAVPFQTTVVTAEATGADDDPEGCSSNGSVWFSFTPATGMTVEADTFGSNYDTVLAVYTGSRGALQEVPDGCNDDTDGRQSRVVFEASAGTTYHFMVAACCGYGGSGGGSLTFSVAEVSGPANDDFADAVAVSGLPFGHTVDTSAAGMEAGEPTYTCGPVNRSVWYAFTATETGSVTARTSIAFDSVLTVFTGTSLTNLSQVGCRSYYYDPLTFRAIAGQTYYLQVGNMHGYDSTVRLSLAVAPPVQAGLGFSPSDPSTFESTSFYDTSTDPGGSQIVKHEWDLGDGTTSTSCCPSHRYAVDGDFTARLTVTTSDGRTGSASRVVRVRTHDVAIDRFAVPESANAGQTRAVSVHVKNVRYDETVRVELYKSVPNGFVLVGSLTQFVQSRTRTTEFPFNYTFTADDAAIGKVTFKAVAVLVGARDALSSDNQVIGTPTRVS